jgi:hypothetical protein
MRNCVTVVLYFLTLSGLCFAQGEQVIELRGKELSIKELMQESARQSGIAINCELVEATGVKVFYDCRTNLNQVLRAVVGYYKAKLDVDLEIVWSGRQVTLRPLARIMEVTDVKPQNEAIEVPKIKKRSTESLWSRLKSKLMSDRSTERRLDEEMGSTDIKKMDLSEPQKKIDMVEKEVDPVDAIPSRLQVELISTRMDLEDEVIELLPTKKDPTLSANAELKAVIPEKERPDTEKSSELPVDLGESFPDL